MDLGNLGGPQSAQAYDINDAGQVVGYATNAAGAQRAFLWQNGAMSDLGTIGGSASVANALNNVGQVVGYSRISSGNFTTEAFLWQNGVMTNLGVGTATPNEINDSGQVVGTRNSTSHGFIWQNGVVTDIGDFGGGGSTANDINNNGLVVGAALTSQSGPVIGPLYHAYLWQNGVMTDVGVLPGMEESGASAINSSGQIVGSSDTLDPETYEVTSKSFLYSGGVMTALPVPSTESYAGDINDSGQVVGTMRAGGGSSNYHAYVYSGGVATNLNSLIPAGSGFHLISAQGINNAGQIVGYAYDSLGHYHAFLLNPNNVNTPSISMSDVTVTEGNTGTNAAVFNVNLSTASNQTVTVNFATSNGSATAADFQAFSGTLTFAPGQTTQQVTVQVNGDRIAESNETFNVNLSQASNAVIADNQAVATIVDDEPRITISDVTQVEGNKGQTTAFVFTVSLSAAYDQAVTTSFRTVNGTANNSDIVAQTGTITFAPGEVTKTITIQVTGDNKKERNENFFVDLFGPSSNALITKTRGVGTILTDD